MQTHISKLRLRMTLPVNKQEGILNADQDNSYYQRMEVLVNSSGRLWRCVETLMKFIRGKGYSDPAIGQMIINRRGWTWNDLVKHRAKDLSRTGGFALHFNYNMLHQITEINFVPFKYCRIVVDKQENPTGEIAIYDDWGNYKRSRINKDKIDILPLYNPSPEIIDQQVAAAGGWDQYKGQVMWYSPEVDTYPLTPFDSEAESGETDFRIKRHKLRNIASGFMAQYMLFVKGKYDEPQKRKLEDDVDQFCGDENSGSIMTVYLEPGQEPFDLKKVDLQNVDKLYEWTAADTYERIRRVFGIPAVLLGDLVAGKMGTARELSDAVQMYNGSTEEYRDLLLQVDKKLMLLWHQGIVIPDTLHIATLSSFTPVDLPEFLLKDWTEDERRELVGKAPKEKQEATTADKLSSFSPLVANKIMDQMSGQQTLDLIGLTPDVEPTNPAP